MQILSVQADPRCQGPLTYHLRWSCLSCYCTTQSVVQGSLLFEGSLRCSGCGQDRIYVFPEQLLSKRLQTIQKASKLEADTLATLSRASRELRDIAYNVNFAAFAHMANVLSREDDA